MAKILDKNKVSTYREHFLSTNEFNLPAVWTDQDATYTLLVRLILLRPGTYPDHPKMGVGLIEKYRYAMEDSISDLEAEIENQIETYLPQFSSVNVDLSLEDKNLNISITIDKVRYEMTYNPETYKLDDIMK